MQAADLLRQFRTMPFDHSKYDLIDFTSEGLAKVKLGRKWGLLNKQGKLFISLNYDEIWECSRGYTVLYNGKRGFIDKQGRILVPAKYDDFRHVSEGFLIILNGYGGFIDKQGRILVCPKYQPLDEFSEGLAAIRLNGKEGYLDKKGNEYWGMTEGEARKQMENR